jgi:hypothetical protein
MDSPTRRRSKDGAHQMPPPPDGEARQEIALRAYYRYCERGRVDGFDIEDWLAAEREVLRELTTTPRTVSTPRRPAARRSSAGTRVGRVADARRSE